MIQENSNNEVGKGKEVNNANKGGIIKLLSIGGQGTACTSSPRNFQNRPLQYHTVMLPRDNTSLSCLNATSLQAWNEWNDAFIFRPSPASVWVSRSSLQSK
jgi:hypothetical protein